MKTDSQLQLDVINELNWDPTVTHTNVGVTAKDGIIALTGHIPSYIEKASAEKAAQRVEGVKAVVNEIDVKLYERWFQSDEEIARMAVKALQWNVQVPFNVNVSVENGRITLRGEVDWEYQRSAAANCLASLAGVVDVNNHIRIRTRVQPANLKSMIEQALKRAAENDSREISVDVKGSKVILTGRVRSFAEIRDARLAAWSAPGVTDVESKLRLAVA